MFVYLFCRLIATTSTNLAKPIISLSVIKTFKIYFGSTYKKMIFTNKNVLITDNEIVDFAKFVEVVAIRKINFKSSLLSSYQ